MPFAIVEIVDAQIVVETGGTDLLEPLVAAATDAVEAATEQAGLASGHRVRAGNSVPFATWTALAAATGMSAGDKATVLAADTGTHTDPVVGGTVANSGIYTYSASPAGWQRTGTLDGATASASAAAAAASALTAVNAPGTSGTSSTSNSLSTGNKTFTTQTGKAWVPGQVVMVARTSDAGASRMFGTITAYNSGTGSITVAVADASDVVGTGTFTDWSIALSGPKRVGGPVSMAGSPIIGTSGGSSPLYVAPSVALLDSAGLNNAIGIRLSTNVGQFTGGSGGITSYYDQTMCLGLNFNQNYLNENLNIAAVGIGFESRYSNPGQPLAAETHLRVITRDTRTEHRWISNYGPELESDWTNGSINYYHASRHIFADGNNNSRIDIDLRPSAGNGVIYMQKVGAANAPQIIFQQNDRPPLTQQNVAGNANLPLPYINARNETEVQSPLYLATAGGTSLFGLKSALTLLYTASAANDCVRYSVANVAVTGSITLERFDSNATVTSLMDYRNNGAGKMAINLVAATGGGEYRINGVKVVAGRNTGWTAMTGTGSKATIAAAAAGTASASYAQAELQGALARIAALEARLKSLDDALFAHGLIGA